MNIFRSDSIEFSPSERADKSSNPPLKIEHFKSALIDAGAFGLQHAGQGSMQPEHARIIHQRQKLIADAKDAEIDQLKNSIDQMEFLLMSNDFGPLSKELPVFPEQLAKMEQNVPNPFVQNTLVNCFVPASAVKALFIIYNSEGVVIKLLNINERGNTTVQISAEDIPNGLYTYHLVIDNKLIAAHEMRVL